MDFFLGTLAGVCITIGTILIVLITCGRKVGGLLFWRCGRLGGSLYLRRPETVGEYCRRITGA